MFSLLKWKIIGPAIGAAFLLGMYLGHLVTHQAWEAANAKKLEAAINEHLVDEGHSYSIGKDLDTNLNKYRKEARNESNHIVLSPDGVRLLNERIAKSNATRLGHE